ncbi:sce7726 family protein [Lysobacter antibioticus]|uniref:sce7726 family protein n=1 Tax=Lysobacter antibioticus TaxID=84531 RepID=UPI0011404230|nr:sce7726 family protein [Lysobacter antibioticus]
MVTSLRSFLGRSEADLAIGPLFDEGFRELNNKYRCEYVYKAHIVNKLVFGRHSPRTASVQTELQVGKSVADIVVFNGTSTAYEIKTEFDTSRRLETQTADYLKVFDNVYVVTHPDLIRKYSDIVPDRVGVIALTARNRLSERKSAISNVDSVSSRSIFRIMRQSEYMEAVVNAYGEQPPIPNGVLFKHYEALFSKLKPRDAHAALVSAFRMRTTSVEMADYLSCLPASLRALGYATPLSALQRGRVSQAMGVFGK